MTGIEAIVACVLMIAATFIFCGIVERRRSIDETLDEMKSRIARLENRRSSAFPGAILGYDEREA